MEAFLTIVLQLKKSFIVKSCKSFWAKKSRSKLSEKYTSGVSHTNSAVLALFLIFNSRSGKCG